MQKCNILREHVSSVLGNYAWLSRDKGHSHTAASQGTFTNCHLSISVVQVFLLKDRVNELRLCIHWHSTCKGMSPLLSPAQHISQEASSFVNFVCPGSTELRSSSI